VKVRENDQPIQYTGNTAKLLDGIMGAQFGTYTEWGSEDIPIYVKGLGVHQFWYVGVEGTAYPLTSNVPTKVGTYKIYASFAQGKNFEAVPSDETSIVYIGTLIVDLGDIVSVFGKIDNESYKKFVVVEGKKARNGITVNLPSLVRYGAAYDNTSLTPDGSAGGIEALVANSVKLPDSVLTFNVNNKSNYGDFLEFQVGIVNTIETPNLVDGLYITVHVDFVLPEEMYEPKPQITVNYRNEKLTGFVKGTNYTINGEAVTPVNAEVSVAQEWKGTAIKIVALPTADGRFAGDTTITIGASLEISAELRAVKGDSSSTTATFDGRLNGTTTAMEYKLSSASDTSWKPADNVVTDGLKTGTYNVRLAATKEAFPSASVNVTIFAKQVGIAENDRVIPVKDVTAEAAVAPVAKVSAAFAAGPSPVSKNAGKIAFFSSKSVKSGTLFVFDANGNAVAKIKAKPGSKEIASWNLKDKNGAKVAEGSYVVKGTLVGKDGKKDKVSSVFNVAK